MKFQKLSSLVLFSLSLMIFLSMGAYAIQNTTLVNPVTNFYTNTSRTIILNATINFTSPAGTGGNESIYNVTWWFICGTNYTSFTNNTFMNSSNDDANRTRTLNITASVLAPCKYSVIAEAKNTSVGSALDTGLNSTTVTFTIDRTNPAVTINQPAQGEIVSAKGTGVVLIEYTPTETNLGNASYYLNGELVSSSTSGTASPNITSGTRKNQFTPIFGNNNNSVTLIVEVRDLVGHSINSSTITFGVFRYGGAEPVTVFVTPSGERISSPAQPKGKAITKPLTFGNIGNAGGLLSNPFVWGGIILIAVGGFIWYQNRRR